MTIHEANLINALLGVSKKRQSGPCWCDTIAGTYCVRQEQCMEAQRVMADSGKPDKLTIERCWRGSPRKHINAICLLFNDQEIAVYLGESFGCEFVSESESIMAIAENVAMTMAEAFGLAIKVEDWGESKLVEVRRKLISEQARLTAEDRHWLLKRL